MQSRYKIKSISSSLTNQLRKFLSYLFNTKDTKKKTVLENQKKVPTELLQNFVFFVLFVSKRLTLRKP